MRRIFPTLFLLATPGLLLASEPQGARPLGDSGLWITSQDYPKAALRNDLAGTTRFRLDVTKDGRVGNCVVTQSSGNDELDLTACRLIMERARFSPALDENGKPTTGSFSSAVVWKLTEQLPGPVAKSTIRSLVVEVDGSVSECKGFEGLSTGAVRSDGCPRVEFEPYLDEDENPIRKRVTVSEIVLVEDP